MLSIYRYGGSCQRTIFFIQILVPGMREVGGSIPGRIKQKTLKFEVLLLCLAFSTKELETVWLARSQNNGLGWDITAYPWGGVSVGYPASTIKTGRRSD